MWRRHLTFRGRNIDSGLQDELASISTLGSRKQVTCVVCRVLA